MRAVGFDKKDRGTPHLHNIRTILLGANANIDTDFSKVNHDNRAPKTVYQSVLDMYRYITLLNN